MFSKILNKLDDMQFRNAVRHGGLRCSACGADHPTTDVSQGEILTCVECGEESVARNWVQLKGPPRGWVDRPPASTSIKRMVCDDGDIVWDIPASGKSGGLFFFAIFWCSITGIVSGGFLFAFLFGNFSSSEDTGILKIIVPVMVLFFGLFWAIGLGLMYAAVRNKWARTRVMVTRDEVVLGTMLFSRVKEKRLPRHEVSEVKTEEFYSSNDKPVYGIQIQGGKQKLKFGSNLRDDEKAWLAADLKREILGESATKKAAPAQKPLVIGPVTAASARSFSLLIPDATKHLWPIGILLVIMGCAFIAVGIFLIEPMGESGADAPGFARIFDLIFSFLSSGFRVIWLTMSSVMAVAGMAICWRLHSRKDIQRRLEGNATIVTIREVQRGITLSEQTFPRAEVSAVVTSVSGHSNGKPMHRIDLQLKQKSHTLARWVDATAAEDFAASAMDDLF
jgi:hypothetical protein